MAHTFGDLPKKDILKKTAQNLEQNGFSVSVVPSKEAALEALVELIPKKAAVMTGSSTTLQEIGFMHALEENSKSWDNIAASVWSEDDEEKRADLRRQSTTAEYFLASVNAVTEDGQLVAVDASGSRVGALPFAAKHVVLVVGAQKITTDLDAALKRIREYVFPKEDERAQEAYGVNSSMNKWVILEKDTPGRTTIILVEEELGF